MLIPLLAVSLGKLQFNIAVIIFPVVRLTTPITAAHCLENVLPSDLKVRAGLSFWNTGGVLINVAAFRKHKGYNPKTIANDIAAIYLSSTLTLSTY